MFAKIMVVKYALQYVRFHMSFRIEMVSHLLYAGFRPPSARPLESQTPQNYICMMMMLRGEKKIGKRGVLAHVATPAP